jgi:hypothetical protein
MVEMGLSPTRTVVLLYALCILLGIVDLLLLRVWKYVAFGVLAVVFIAAFAALELRAQVARGS